MDYSIAFFDDSGDLHPGSGQNFCSFGMVVVSIANMKEINDKWLDMVASHLQVSKDVIAINGIEAKSSDLYELRRRLDKGKPLTSTQSAIYKWGLKTSGKVDALIEDIWDFLANPPKDMRYIASVANKSATWGKFKMQEYQRFQQIYKTYPKRIPKELGRSLVHFIGEKSFEWLLQRLNFLGNPSEMNFTGVLLIGDESSISTLMYNSQASAQAGLSKFTTLPKIMNNVWFGSSLHNPCLQIADWVAYAVRTWAEKRQASNMRLKSILPSFRGYPNTILGRGIVTIPNQHSFPKLPK